MIARLSGTLAESGSDSAVVDVGGVGYLVHLSARTLGALGPIGGEVLVLTELQVREDAWTLFGFGSPAERDAFRALTSVQGVGGRLALAILSILPPDELARAVAQDDKAMIGRANGVGPKLAARIANELQGKLGVVPPGASAHAARRRGRRCALRACQPRFQAGRGQRRRQRRPGRARRRCHARCAGAAGAQEGGTLVSAKESAMQLSAVLTPAEEGGYVAHNPETLTTTEGDTIEEALANLKEAVELYLEVAPLRVRGNVILTTLTIRDDAAAAAA